MAEHVKFFAKGTWVDQHLAQWLTIIMIITQVGLASAIAFGGESRFSEQTYYSVVVYTNGNVWIWAAWLGASAILMSVPFRWVNISGLWLGMTWHIIWMACFTIAASRFDNAAVVPIPVYAGFAMINAALLTARVIDKSRE